MNKGQTQGMIAIVVGFVIVAIAGVILSFIAVDVISTTQTIITAIVVFLATSPLFGFGMYKYARSTELEAYSTNEDMAKPRLLLDMLRDNAHGDVVAVAQELNATPDEIKLWIDDLVRLDLFTGIADWKNGVIAMVEPSVISAIDSCKTCQTPIQITGHQTICPTCGTEYYKTQG